MKSSKNKLLDNTERAQIKRLKELDRLISIRHAYARTRESLSRALEIGEDSISKDLDTLKKIIAEYNEEKGTEIKLLHLRNKGYRYNDESFRVFDNELIEDEYSILNLSAALFNIFSNTKLHGNIAKIINKIKDGKVPNADNMDFIQKAIHFQSQSGSNGSDKLDKILELWFQRNCIEIEYKNEKGGLSKKNICPYVLKQHNNNWYMVGYDYNCNRDQKTNVFDLNNIIGEVRISGRPYKIDLSFDADNYFKYSLGIWHEHYKEPIEVSMKILNDELFNRLVKRPIHNTQCVIKAKNIISIQVYESIELYSLIKSYGKEIKVLSPQSVADRIKAEAQAILKLYK